MSYQKILETAISHYGATHQKNIAIEEMAELQKELVKDMRGELNERAVLEELADVYIMLEQLMMIYDFRAVDLYNMKKCKLERLKKRLEGRTDE